MALVLYGHPFSSYCQKALIALHENATAFELRLLGPEPETWEAFGHLWPLRKMPVLVDGDRAVMEASIIVEHLSIHHPGPVRLLPADPAEALEARLMDRVFDNYVATPMQKIVLDVRRPAESRDPLGVAEARALLGKTYAWLDGVMTGRAWAAGAAFSLADCAAAPALLYADWVEPIPPGLAHARAYRRRLLERPSVRRVVDEARPYRPLFPPGAPDRD